MPRVSSKNKEPEWQMAVCTVCLDRRIKKRSSSTSFEKFMDIAKKNNWKWNYDDVCKTLTFICPDCSKNGYDFE